LVIKHISLVKRESSLPSTLLRAEFNCLEHFLRKKSSTISHRKHKTSINHWLVPFKRKRCQSASDVIEMGEPSSALASTRNFRNATGLTSAEVEPWHGTEVADTTPNATPVEPNCAGPVDGAAPPVPVPSKAAEPESPLHVPGRGGGLRLPDSLRGATGLAKKRSMVGPMAEDATRGRRCKTPEVYEVSSSTLMAMQLNTSRVTKHVSTPMDGVPRIQYYAIHHLLLHSSKFTCPQIRRRRGSGCR